MMSPDELRRAADALEQRLKAGRPGRHTARAMTVGRLVASGKAPISMAELESVRQASVKEPDSVELLSLDGLEWAGYKRVDGKLVGPSTWPGEAPGDAPLPEGDEASAGAGESGSGGGGAMSLSEARRHVEVARDYADWLADTRRLDMWNVLQERRALLFGRALLRSFLGNPKYVAWVRERVKEGGKEAEIELWAAKVLRSDYTAVDLGEGVESGAGRPTSPTSKPAAG